MWGALIVALALSSVVGVAHAERKRVVVLEFEGPRGERFHDDLVKLLKKTQTVVSTNQWNNTAEQLDAATMLDKDVRRVAKKLKVDAIVEGKIEKRRDSFLIHLKLREGKTGEVVRAGIGTKSEGPRIDARAQRDIKEELIGAIDEVEPNGAAGADDDRKRVARAEEEADDEDAAPASKRGKKADQRGAKAGKGAARRVASRAEADDEEDDRSAKRHARDDEDADAPAAKKGKKADDRGGKKVAKGRAESAEEDEDALPRKGKKGASRDDDDADAPKKGKKGATRVASSDADDEDKLPPKKAKGDAKKTAKVASSEADDEDKLPAKKAKDGRFSKRPEDERGSDRVDAAGDEERAALRPKTDDDAGSGEAGDGEGEHRASSTRVASSDDDGTRVEAGIEPGGALGGDAAKSPGQRAIELVAGASMTVRRMSFDVRPDLEQRPASYKGGRAPGAILDATVYPLALGHRRAGILKDFGLTVMYDRVLKVSSHSQLTDMTYETKETRLGAGLVFRHAFGSAPTAPVLLGSLTYSSQVFRIAADLDTPNVKYTMFEPGLGLRLPVTARLIVGADAKLMLITNTGQIQEPEQYGTAKVLGLEGAVALDYVFGGGLFARAAFRYETIGYTFKGNGLLSVNRDHMGMTQDVNGARDTYLGGIATLGFVY